MTEPDETETLLTANDPAPVEVVNPAGASPILLVCEHAGRAVNGVDALQPVVSLLGCLDIVEDEPVEAGTGG